ncbi:uncharacterized protein LOC111697271, partial [Eurytemora carolleeae]|uniref:uncharacterized protein LOC111697271 n=1 Tax=Eurytemora carolleeae TaxID=1294199 RepID=UPI000C76D492
LKQFWCVEGVICLLAVLIVVLIIDTRVSGATNFDKVVQDLNSSIDFQNELRGEIQTVGEKLNTAVSDIRVMKDNSTFNRLKLMLRPVLESLKTSLKTNISANGRNIDKALKTAADNERKYIVRTF